MKAFLLRSLLVVVTCFPMLASAELQPHDFTVSNNIYKKVNFIPHSFHKGQTYLTMNVNYTPVKNLFNKLDTSLSPISIKTRGEAHITVITPPEYENILKPYIKPKELDQIAIKYNIQNPTFKILCLGQAKIYDFNKQKFISTYFLVVKSQQLLQIRKAIYDLYVARGGLPSHFDPEHFTPHITVGYTDRDLFERDGVFKNTNACFAQVLVNSKQ